ncbi:HNH endonuclease signature motif containing protein [Arthrobacter sp.]|uniref:HNH endonuclease signature motif containing protein n=1 Tax=Arthrobacter sp. TaxID=1667 RepID=UPI0025833266|nr:HNH endonuclease signature motif containing protein [Arthrobacter sp.]
MEATARTPGHPGSTRDGRGAGGHVRRLIALAEALARAATTASQPPDTTAPGAGPGAGTGAAAASGTAASRPAHTGAPGAGGPFGVDVDALSDAQAVSWAQELERLGCFLAALQVQAAGSLAGRVRAGRFDGVRHPGELLALSLNLGRGEAGRRVRLASKFLPATDPLNGAVTGPEQPLAAAAFFAGALSAGQAAVASRFIEDARHLADAGTITGETAADVEDTLTGYAGTMDPDSFARVGVRTINTLDPDGQQPSEGELIAKQGITFRQPRRGLVHFDGWATVPQYETWMAGIASAANPRQHTELNPDTPNTSTDGAAAGTDATAGSGAVMPGQTDLDSLLSAAGGLGSLDDRDMCGGGGALEDSGRRDGPGIPGRTTGNEHRGGAYDSGNQGQDVPGLQKVCRGDPAGEGQSCGNRCGEDPRGGCWPPPGQGPAPDFAQDPAPDPAQDPPGGDTDTGGSAGTGQDQANAGTGTDQNLPWPRLVDGTWVPAPGADGELPRLDPIDPACTNPVVADRRTRAQKLLDGTIQGIKLAARTGKLPMNGGLKPQLFISTTEADLQHRTRDGRPGGFAFLPYSGPQPLALFATELCDADVTTMILGNGQEILNVGRTQRLFTPAQRKILIARDKGCSFPHCRQNALATEAHHIIPWSEGGQTNVSSGCLLCAFHHHLIHKGDWSVQLIDGTPWYTPPYRLDPHQTRLRNTYHHGLPQT